ncbi:MAG: type II toxin-antitoxin system RelE/ParE family toxin [Saprospiraceae bacterium]|nr:type II toxin-antitoxin system RelE/ParE family toxin [Candidatus Vicinibacter affinis]MBK6573884.1 type II toxin-antitoxin system RelE/ParE family toxin [Candidatus Vicinibacter affinis]MBK6821675.1 type II toxin-antitoxin system RelE/ParE family toxin [Candidatus Vicinibacter affinis]MBK7695211.1 type II toxin-antitoxin system RelE/ParE family toxin [Candidatus Vicinibacter affinis]MBK7800172.1 type II toxin-antitoxin system RelE/ParE family toxin [Candidatus Vicinibacter affinis]
MIVEYERSFYRSLEKLKDQSLFKKLENIILRLEAANSLSEIVGAYKLTGYKNYYKIRIGSYRLGFEKISSNRIRLIIIANRKDIYNIFP